MAKKSKIDRFCILRHGYFPEDPRVYKEVQALRYHGFSVDVICLRKPEERCTETVDGVRVYRLPYSHRRGSIIGYLFEYGLSFSVMSFLVTVFYLCRRYSCIQVNTLPDALVFATLIPRLLGAKVVLDMHEPAPELWLTEWGETYLPALVSLQAKIEQMAIRYADKVLTVNETIRRRFIRRGADAGKIGIVRNVPSEGLAAAARPSGHQEGFRIMTHGTIEPRYGHEVIVRALPALRDKIGGLRVYIVGDGKGTAKLFRLSQELGCSDLISYTGFKPFSQIPGYILRSDIGLVPLLPSPFSELCQPNKLFEYVALKTPVVVSRLRAIEESFDDSCVMFFEPGNPEDLAGCVLELYNNPGKGRKLAENAYRRYENIRWEKTKNVYLKIIQGLMNS